MNEPMEEEPFAEDTVTGTAPREEERGLISRKRFLPGQAPLSTAMRQR